jgi:acyl transferase domain-containing protein
MRHPLENARDERVLYHALSRLWLAGLRIDWNGFDDDVKQNVVSLPTYPFERQNYLVNPQQKALAGPRLKVHKTSDIAQWLYVPCWRQTAPLQGTGAADDRFEPDTLWLVFSDGHSLGEQLIAELRDERQRVLGVERGAAFAQTGENRYAINPRLYKDYVSLFDKIGEEHGSPTNIVHLWNTTDDSDESASAARFTRIQETGFYNLIYLAQVIERQKIFQPVQISLVTNGAHDVTGSETLVPEKATLRGPCLVIPQEYPHISCRQIDVEVPSRESASLKSLAESLLVELSEELPETIVALRGKHRWIPALEHCRVDSVADRPPLLRTGGTYLILGGLGGIGLTLAKFLAENANANLVLTGRVKLPEKDEWDQWLKQHEPDETTSRRILAARELEELGADVLVLDADVGSLDDMQRVLQESTRRFGAINGVVHAAGIVETTSIHYLIQKDCERHFRAKVHGLLVLDEVLQTRELDFVLLASSLSSVLGGLGFCAYTAANAYMDTFALVKNRTQEVPWIVVNWDAWSFIDEQEKPQTGVGAGLAELAITPSEGREVFGRVLSMKSPQQVVISTGNLNARMDQWVRRKPASKDAADDTAEEAATTLHARPSISTDYIAPRNDLEEAIGSVWRQLLGIAEIGIHDDFFELGGHSLLAGQVIARLQEKLQLTLSLRSIFESSTIAGLATHIEALQVATGAPSDEHESSTEEREEMEF